MKNFISLTKQQYETKKEEILNDGSLTVKTKAKTNRRKLEHKTIISSELGDLILEISGDETTYSFKVK